MVFHPQDSRNDPSGHPDNRTRKRSERLLASASTPILPSLARILFWFSCVVIGASIVIEVTNYRRYAAAVPDASIMHLLTNMSVTLLGTAGIASALLVPVCLAGIHAEKKAYLRKVSGDVPPEGKAAPEDRRQKERADSAVSKLCRSYRIYLTVILLILAAAAVFFLAVRIGQ